MDFDSRKNTYITFAKEKKEEITKETFFYIFFSKFSLNHGIFSIFLIFRIEIPKLDLLQERERITALYELCPSRQFVIRVWDNNIELLTVLTFLQIIAYYFHLYPREA